MIFKKKYFLSFFILLYCLSGLFYAKSAETIPPPRGYINDFSDVLSPDTENRIRSVCQIIKEKSGIEISLVFLDTTKPLDIALYSVKLFEKWGIGEKGKDNGVLFIAAIKDRQARIEVGYGLEGILPDGYCGAVLDSVTPYFAKGDYDRGGLAGITGIVSKIAKEYNIDLRGALPTQKYSRSGKSNPLRSFIGMLFFIFFISSRLGFFPFFMGRRRRYGSRGLGGFSGSRGSGGFGGFGGFGGGLSGGGGAGRSW